MTREELKSHILNTYDIDSDFPWLRDPESEIFRHPENRKWFVLLTNAPVSALAPSTPSPIKYKNTLTKSEQTITVINVKVDPVLSGSLRTEPGIYPAYHMNKDNWITVDISVVPDDTIKWLIDMSFTATAPKAKKMPKEKKPNKIHTKYPEIFFKDLFGTESSDVEYADFLIDLLRPINPDSIDDEANTRIRDMRDIIFEYYKQGKTQKEIGKKRGVSGQNISDKRWKGLRRIRHHVNRNTDCSAYEDNETNDPPLTFSEYNKLADKKSKLVAQREKEKAKKQYEYEHGSLSLTDEIQRLNSFNDNIHDASSSFFHRQLSSHGILTIGELLELTGCEKLPGFGKKRWELIRKAQAEARERLSDE